MQELKRTPLFSMYETYGAKTIDFGGWELPVQFTSIKAEHEVVRTKAGLFDISHMGEIEIKGKNSLSFLQHVMTNDIAKLKDGKAMYTVMCYDDGGTVDDLLVYKKKEQDYLLVVNAANTEKDFSWLQTHLFDDVEIKNVSLATAQLAIQGPRAVEVLQKLTNTNVSEIAFFSFKESVSLNGTITLVSRTGYTGEDGFELYCSSVDVQKLWHDVLEAGKEMGIQPIGLGARDTLRFEAGLALYGQELSPSISPIEAGLGFAVKIEKSTDFIGKGVLAKQKIEGTKRKLVGVEMTEKGIPRTNYCVYADEKCIGHITSGTQSPTLKKNIGLALLHAEYTPIGTEVDIDIRGNRRKGKVVETPFYRR